MQTEFQVYAHLALAEFAQQQQLSPCPLLKSENGTEYKNYRNDTLFTVYHDRLDDENKGRIELALGVKNIATELSCPTKAVEIWLSRTQLSFHSAQSKSPQWWPRLAVWSLEEVRLFCRAFESLVNSKSAPVSVGQNNGSRPFQAPPADERVMREILSRQGQPEFRSALLNAYGGRCAFSGCADIPVLEAAHITPHSETQDYRPKNGLLLRADLHTLFDLHLISLDPRTAKVGISRRLSATYQVLNGRVADLPADLTFQPDVSALMRHFTLWQAGEQSNG